MNKKLKIKICGINDNIAMSRACNLNIDYIGLVFYKRSPRNVSLSKAKILLKYKNSYTKLVALTVNPDDKLLESIYNNIKPDYFQLHGNEKPARCFEIKKKFNVKIIKALNVDNIKKLTYNLKDYRNLVNTFLFDSPAGILPGGNGKKFNWKSLYNNNIKTDWLLAGGINALNVEKAIKLTHAKGIDISSGIEISKGRKSPQLIENFIRRCRNI